MSKCEDPDFTDPKTIFHNLREHHWKHTVTTPTGELTVSGIDGQDHVIFTMSDKDKEDPSIVQLKLTREQAANYFYNIFVERDLQTVLPKEKRVGGQ